MLSKVNGPERFGKPIDSLPRAAYAAHQELIQKPMIDAFAPLFVLLAFVLLAVTSWFWGADTVAGSLNGSDGRLVRWSLQR